jgi:hypothetical protein
MIALQLPRRRELAQNSTNVALSCGAELGGSHRPTDLPANGLRALAARTCPRPWIERAVGERVERSIRDLPYLSTLSGSVSRADRSVSHKALPDLEQIMKRRDIILASAGILVPALGRAAQPCPPPRVSVSGGGSAITTCGIVTSGTSYSTEFTVTENPLSEGGRWASPPQPSGIKWTRMVSDAAMASGTGVAYGTNGAKNTYDDSYAKFVGFEFPSATSIEIVAILYRSPSLARGSAYPEKELWFCIDDGVNGADAFLRGYEVMLNPGGFSNMGKWLGGQTSDQIPVFPNAGGVGDVPDGAEFKATITRSGSTNTISMYYNGVLQYQNTDTNFGGMASYSIGRPGFGAFGRPGQPAHELFGFRSITIRAL